jgi:hypothetical protein
MVYVSMDQVFEKNDVTGIDAFLYLSDGIDPESSGFDNDRLSIHLKGYFTCLFQHR